MNENQIKGKHENYALGTVKWTDVSIPHQQQGRFHCKHKLSIRIHEIIWNLYIFVNEIAPIILGKYMVEKRQFHLAALFVYMYVCI